ncbi:hypothetical protein D9M68_911540 [compost metagenome]
MRRHLHHPSIEVEHLGAIGAAGNDLAVQLVLDAGFGFEHTHGRDVLNEAQLAGHVAVLVAQR